MTCALSSGTAGDRTTNLSRRICSHHGPCPACGYSHGCSDQLSPLRSSADTDTSIRIPMRRTADHRSGNKGSPMDGHTQSALMARVVASMFVTCIRTSHPGAATTFRTRRTRLRVAWDGLGRRCLVPDGQFPSRVMDCSTNGATLRSWVPDDYVARLNPRAHTGAYSLAS